MIEARGRVPAASQRQDIAALGQAETALRFGLGQSIAVVEAYPELRSSEHFARLIDRIVALEEGIADRREIYNDSVSINNVRIEVFPDNIVARLFGFLPRPLSSFLDALFSA